MIKYRIIHNCLLAYPSVFSRKPESTTDLQSVRFISWYVSPFSQKRTIRLKLWDGIPHLRPGLGLLPGESLNDRKDVHEIGQIRTLDLLKNTEAHKSFINLIASQVQQDLTISTVNLDSLQPTKSLYTEPFTAEVASYDWKVLLGH